MSRWDGVEATSFIRLVAARPYSAANVEASDRAWAGTLGMEAPTMQARRGLFLASSQ